MDNVEEIVRRTIRKEKLIDPGDRVLVGVSGGIDSSTLLFLLHKLTSSFPFTLAVAHVNHRLRGGEADRDEAFVRETAERLGVPFHAARFDVHAYASAHGLSVQHAGRDVRYGYFEELCEVHGYEKIAIAHHRDDQVETFLLRVIKGTGIHGLSSIPLRRSRIIRPLLYTYRSEIEAYASRHSIACVHDSSNAGDTYERNFLRNRIVPVMEQLNPRFREKILLLLRDLTAINTLFDDEAAHFLGGEQHRDGTDVRVDTARLRALHPEVRFRVISRILCHLQPSFVALREHIVLVEKSLFSARPNNVVTLPYGIKVKRTYGQVLFTQKSLTVPPVGDTFEIRTGKNHLAPLGVTLQVSRTSKRPSTFPTSGTVAYFDDARISRISVRTFREGDRFVPLGMRESVKLKDYFISRKIPRERRRSIPLLLSDNQVIWVVGERIDQRYRVTDETRRFVKVIARFEP